jgi:hypothetical protein
MSTTSENLDRRFKGFISNEQPFGFFKGLNEYINYALSQPDLAAVMLSQVAERDARYTEIGEVERKSVAEMRQAKAKLLAVIKENDVDVTKLQRFSLFGGQTTLIEELEAFDRGDYRMTAETNWRSEQLERFLFEVAANLRDAGYGEKISEFVASQDQYDEYRYRIDGESSYSYGGGHGLFIFSQTWPERFELEALLKKERDLKPWGDFEALLQFKDAYDEVAKNGNLASILHRNADAPPTANDRAKVAMMVEDLQIIMGDGSSTYRHQYSHRPDQLYHLHIIAFRSHAQMVHNLLMQVAEEPDVKIIKNSETNHTAKELSVADKKKLFILEKLDEEWEFVQKLEPKLIKLHWSRYEKWLKDSGIEDNGQLMNILLGLKKEGLITDCKWVNPAR